MRSIRSIIPISILLLLLALALPLLLIYSPVPALPVMGEGDEPYEEEVEAAAPDGADHVQNGGVSRPGGQGLQDEQLILQVLLDDTVHEMSMAEFLQGAVAAEMPARFHPEALRAQAVAARTYTLHRMLVAPTARHPAAYVCGSYACCKAFHSTERLRERWGASFDYYSAIIAEAVHSTDGVILLYEDQPILAAFHAASYGHTEASGAIWGHVPYLQSVRSFEGAYEVPRFTYTVRLSFDEFRDIARREFPGAVLDTDNIPNWIRAQRHTDSGRIDSLEIGGVTVTGPQFRRAFGLRSTMVRFAFDADGIDIITGGHGHGVGMSQFGANTMATMGLGFEAILHWYYTNVILGDMDSLFDLT